MPDINQSQINIPPNATDEEKAKAYCENYAKSYNFKKSSLSNTKWIGHIGNDKREIWYESYEVN